MYGNYKTITDSVQDVTPSSQSKFPSSQSEFHARVSVALKVESLLVSVVCLTTCVRGDKTLIVLSGVAAPCEELPDVC
jgi:hypothetical protein